MKSFLLSLMLMGAFLLPQFSLAQCVPDSTVPTASGIYPDSIVIPGCQFVDTVVTFILPRDTSETVGGVTIPVPFIDFIIDSISGLPDGISWECNLGPDCRYVVSRDSANVDTIGCIRLFGTSNVPAFYNITVNLTASFVLFGQVASQASTLSAPLRVQPCEFIGDCYSLSLDSNCEPTLLGLTNNIPSNGKSGFDYNWSITSPNGFSFATQAENPADQLLNAAGDYYISYDVNIDTIGYFLTNARIDAVACSDILDGADLYWYLISPSGDTLANTSGSPLSNVGNNLPVFTGITTGVLDSGTYDLQVWDRDNVIADAGCTNNTQGSGASLNFTIPPSNDDSLTVSVGGLTVTLFFDHPTQTVSCADTLTIFPLPDAPVLVAGEDTLTDPTIDWCVTQELELTALGDSVEWFLNGNQLPSIDGMIQVQSGGTYEAFNINTSTFCRSAGSSVEVMENEIAPPAVVRVVDTIFVGSPNANFIYTWFDINGNELAQGPSFTPQLSGQFYATATEIATNCASIGSDTIQLTLTSIEDLLEGTFAIYPNPAHHQFTLQTQLDKAQSARISLLDLMGREVKAWNKELFPGEMRQRFDITGLQAGIYVLQLRAEGKIWTQKLMLE